MRLVEHESRGMNIYVELQRVWADCDIGDDNSVTVNSVWLFKAGLDDLEITPWLSEQETEQIEQSVIYELEKAASKREAMEEERGTIMTDIAKEEQERILAENKKWYGQRYHAEQAETHRSLSTDVEGHWK